MNELSPFFLTPLALHGKAHDFQCASVGMSPQTPDPELWYTAKYREFSLAAIGLIGFV